MSTVTPPRRNLLDNRLIGGLLRERVGAEGQASVLDISQAKKLLEA